MSTTDTVTTAKRIAEKTGISSENVEKLMNICTDFDGMADGKAFHQYLTVIKSLSDAIAQTFLRYVDDCGRPEVHSAEAFVSGFKGSWESFEAFFRSELLEEYEHLIRESVPEDIQRLIKLDEDAIIGDLLCDHYVTLDQPDGKVLIFDYYEISE